MSVNGTGCRILLYDVSFFFFKQKTAYEMRISDWSSDVCSSDLFIDEIRWNGKRFTDLTAKPITVLFKLYSWDRLLQEGIAGRKIGRASCRERVCQYV